MRFSPYFPVPMVLAALIGAPAQAQFTYPGCADLQSSDFQRTELFSRSGSTGAVTVSNLSEPVAMAFNAVKSGDSVLGADIYLVQREGVVRKYDFLAKTVRQIGFINNAEAVESGNGDNGLMGIALDPGFATNRWIYLWYGPPRTGTNNYRARLSRFTLGLQDTVQPATEKILIDMMMSKTRQWHSGGPMRFDAHGDLWVTIGNNGSDLSGSGSQYHVIGSNFTVNQGDTTWRPDLDSNYSQEWGASNTASLRGGVIRIHPDNSAPKGYTIPAGNFGAYWADYFQGQGNATLAAQYRDTNKVLPEIYVKGTRSNYSLWVHPTKRWLAWGEVNYSTTNDEFHMVTTPAFTGFPYFHKNNIATPGTINPAKVASAPTNTSPMNSGVTQLPPAAPAVVWYGASVTDSTFSNNVSMGGDVYLYDRNLKSGVKFPPHYHHSWLLMQSFNASTYSLYGVRIDSATAKPTGPLQRLDNGVLALTTAPANIRRPIQASYGPDGALYFLNYTGGDYATTANSGVLRVTYNGSCVLPPVSVRQDHRANPADLDVRPHQHGILVREGGDHVITLSDASGRLLARRTGTGHTEYRYADLWDGARAEAGVYVVTVKAARGIFVRQISRL
jgi:glucose/arabinose dehydrogenase